MGRGFVHNTKVLGRWISYALALAVMSGCGRLGFDRDAGARSDDASRDDAPVDGLLVVDPLSALDDGFEGNGLEPDWSKLNPNDIAVGVEGGVLTITPATTGYWFNGDQGGLIYKQLTSDFMVTADISVENFASPGTPTASNCLGLILARNPISALQNNVWIGVGSVSDQWSVEPKNTLNGVSEYARSDWSQRAILRICRIGASFRMLAREPASSTWIKNTEYVRPDLPGELQVGLSAACTNAPLDLVARVEAVAFATPTVAADCLVP